jgi:hypothetical protein
VGQIVQILGALAILAGFALAQRGAIYPQSLSYLGLNLAGATVLSANAWVEGQWEGSRYWALVTGVGFVNSAVADFQGNPKLVAFGLIGPQTCGVCDGRGARSGNVEGFQNSGSAWKTSDSRAESEF